MIRSERQVQPSGRIVRILSILRPKGLQMEMLDALSQTFDHTTKIVSGVRADQLDDQTPCSEWPLRMLLAHMTGVVVNMGLGASGKELLPSVEGFVIEPADLGAQFRSEADRTLAAWGDAQRWRPSERRRGADAGECRARHQLARHSWAHMGRRPLHRTGHEPSRHRRGSAAYACAKQIVSDEIRGFAGFAPWSRPDPTRRRPISSSPFSDARRDGRSR